MAKNRTLKTKNKAKVGDEITVYEPVANGVSNKLRATITAFNKDLSASVICARPNGETFPIKNVPFGKANAIMGGLYWAWPTNK